MAVIGMVFKIIGLTILVFLGLVLLLLFFILFCPIHYQLEGSYYEKWNGRLRITWLFSLIRFQYEIMDGISTQTLRIFWWNPLKENKPKRKRSASKIEVTTKVKDYTQKSDKIEQISLPDTQQLKGEPSKRKQSGKKRKFRPLKRIKETVSNIWGMIKRFKEMVTNEIYQKAVKHLLRELIRILKKICPRRMALDVEYSCGTPDWTALVIGFVACFPLAFQNKWRIQPDFDSQKAYAKGTAKGRGNVILFPILCAVVRIMVDKNCRKLYNDFND